MASPPHRSLATSLAQHLGGGAAVVVLAAGAFYGIGLADGAEPAASSRDDATEAPPPEVDEPDEPDEDELEPDEPEPEPDDPPEPDEPVDDDDADEGEAADDRDDEASDDGADDADTDDADDADDEASDDGQDEAQEAPPALDPADVTVQVLDGYQADGGAAANQVADRLVAAGYDLIAQNPALRRDETTVFYTDGNEPAARQVANELGVGRVEVQPGNLSTSVHVHVVIGSDRG